MSQMLPEIFEALAGDAAGAMEDAGEADARFIEQTADNEDTALENIAGTERSLAAKASAIGEKASADAGAAAGGDAGDGAAGAAGAEAGGGGGEPGLAAAAGDPAAARSVGELPGGGDPVDVATGDVFLAETDVALPGVLPLVLERVHRSSWRAGRWFGRSWMSSFDQRLLVTPGRVIGAFAEGRVLTWTALDGSGEAPVLPVTGPSWPLRRDGDGSYTVTDPQRGLAWRFGRPRGLGVAAALAGGGELPLLAVSDRAGHQVTFSYDRVGQPAGVTHSGGYQVRVAVAGGRVTELVLAGPGAGVRLAGYEYDEAGDLAGVINSSGQPLRFSYDEAGRLTGWADRTGHSYRYSYDSEGRCVRGDGPDGKLSGTFRYDQGRTRWTDAEGAVTAYEVTESARIAAVTDPLGNVTRWQHDPRGRVTARADPLGRVSRYAYDERGNLVTITRPDGSTAHAEYDENCQPVRLTGPDGTGWRQVFDARGNRTMLTGPDGAVTRFGYDDHGHLASVTAPDGAATTLSCNRAGLPVAVTRPGGARARFERDQSGRITRITGPDGGVTAQAWTIEGRLASRTLPDGAAETLDWDADGNPARHVSPAGAVTRYEYGTFGQPASVRWPDGAGTEFSYDHALRLTQVVHGGLTWRYEYDRAGRLAAETDYNGATTSYDTDAAGQRIRQVNAAGQELRFAYDVLGNLTERSAGGAVTAFGYDPAGRLESARNADAEIRLGRDQLGRVTAETCNGATVRSEYDAAGRITRLVTPSGIATGWDYNQAGQPAQMTDGQHDLRFGYDPAGREIRRDLPGGLTLTQDWDPAGRLTSQTLTGQTQPGPTQPGLPGTRLPEGPAAAGMLLQRRAYTYRADGYPDSIDDLLDGNRTLALDPAGRVTAVTGPGWAEDYAYDPAGNLTNATWPAPPPAATARLDTGPRGRRRVTGTLTTRAGNLRYRYDRAGRVTSRQRIRDSRKAETWTYQWDADNRLTQVTTPDGTTWAYRYDPLGRRIAKHRLTPGGQPADETSFTWHGPVLAEQTDSTSGHEHVSTWTYQPGTTTPLTQAEHTTHRDAPQDDIDQRFYAIVTDLAGTPAELTAPDGTLAGHQQHTLWGETAWTGAETPLRFPGQYADPETGLHYNNQRYYDPATARYLTPDPLGLTPAPNPHTYVPNPFTTADPLGLDPVGGPAVEEAGGTTQVFRTVGSAEARDIAESGVYRNPEGLEGKYFYPTQAQAENLGAQYAKMGLGEQTLTSGRITIKLLNQLGEPIEPAGEGSAFFLRNDLLAYITNVTIEGPLP